MNIHIFKYLDIWGLNVKSNVLCRDTKDLFNPPLYLNMKASLFLRFSLSVSLSLDVYTIFYSRWNPFARKSRGILGVIKAQAKRNRVVSKHGRINVYRKTEDNENQHRFAKHSIFIYFYISSFHHEWWTISVWTKVCVTMFWQIPERLLHLNDWPGLVVDPALVLRRILPLLAHILCCLVPHRPGSRGPGPQGPWPQSLCRKCQRLHIRISVQPRDSAHNWVSYDKTINSLMLYVMILISPISTLCFGLMGWS